MKLDEPIMIVPSKYTDKNTNQLVVPEPLINLKNIEKK